MAKDNEHACRDDKCCVEIRRIRHPFNMLIDTCCDGIIHQQFRLSVKAEASDQPTVVYAAPPFDTPVTNGPGITGEGAVGSAAIQQVGPVFPFGTVVATNLSAAAFTFIVEGDAEEDTEIVVPPGSQAAITAPRISLVLVVHPTDPIRGVFDFDIFYPTDPIHPGDPV